MRRNNMLLIYLTNKKDKVNRKRKYLGENRVGMKDQHGFDLRKGPKIGGRKCYLMTFLKSFGKKLQNGQRCLSPAGYYVRSICWPQNYSKLSIPKKLVMVLYYLKDTGSLWMTPNAFGVHQCTVSKTLV